MPITGKFQADFADFSRAVDNAVVELRELESGGHKVESSLNRMVDSFSGRKVITDATLMVEAVERVGGTSKLTEREFARLGTTVAAASEKMRAMGVVVPPQMQAIADGASRATREVQRLDTAGGNAATSFGKLSRGLGSVDNLLGVVGVRGVTQYTAALRDMEGLAGSLGVRLGTLGTVAGVAAAGFGVFKLTQWAREAFELDEAIGALAAEYMGWGNVLEVEAAEGVRELSRASVIAGRSITDMSEAARINAAEAKRMGEEHTKAAAAAVAAFDAFKRAKADAAAGFARQDEFREGLIGTDAIAKAREYLVALQILREQGLQPLKSKHEEITTALQAAMTAMENLGQTGTLGYQRMAAEVARLQPLLENTANLSRLIFAPAAIEGQGVTAAVQAAELATWIDRVQQEYRELDAEVDKYYRLQGIAFDDTVDGANAATAAITRLAAAMSRPTFGPTVAAGPGYTPTVTGRPTFGSLQPGPVSITINNTNPFYDTPESINRLANRVGDAVLQQVRSRGGLVR